MPDDKPDIRHMPKLLKDFFTQFVSSEPLGKIPAVDTRRLMHICRGALSRLEWAFLKSLVFLPEKEQSAIHITDVVSKRLCELLFPKYLIAVTDKLTTIIPRLEILCPYSCGKLTLVAVSERTLFTVYPGDTKISEVEAALLPKIPRPVPKMTVNSVLCAWNTSPQIVNDYLSENLQIKNQINAFRTDNVPNVLYYKDGVLVKITPEPPKTDKKPSHIVKAGEMYHTEIKKLLIDILEDEDD